MKRERATALVEDVLRRLDAGGDWPLNLVDAVHLFGSYARGALDPHDVDLAVDFTPDERMHTFLVNAIFSGRNPHSPLRQSLAGRSRGLQFQFGAAERRRLEDDGVPMLRLWQRGDTLTQALDILHGITPDATAGRAPRDDMAEEFEGLDRVIPRPVRADLLAWRDAGHITLTRLTLPDTPLHLDTPEMRWAVNRRWADHSPLRRTALAALEYLRTRGADLGEVELSGHRLPTPARMAGADNDTRWWITWKWQHYRAIPHCLADGHGWLEVPAPTRTRPLHALLLTPGPTPLPRR